MMTRVSTSAGSKAMLAGIQASYGRLNKAQEQVTTGRRINRVSDDPADSVSSIISRSILKRFEQFGRNANEAESWLLSNDAALSDVVGNISAVRTLVVQAGSGSSDEVALKAIADEVRSIKVSLIGAANASKGGRPIFAGTANVAAAYDETGAYQGNSGAVTIPVLDSITFGVSRTGLEVFGTAVDLVANPGADPMTGDIFQMIDAIANAIEAGDSDTISSSLTGLDDALKRVAASQVDLGTRHAQLEQILSTIEDQKVATTTTISKKEDVDAAEAIMNYKTRLSAYEAAIAVSAKVMQPSLLDFLT